MTARLFAGALALLALSSMARAQVPQQPAGAGSPRDQLASCITAFEEAQRERAAARLLAAMKLAFECSRPACGSKLLGAECTQMYTEIERSVPSVVLSAHDEARDTDVTDVEVTMNGQPLATSLDGKPIPVDPGDYELVFKLPGRAPVTQRVVVGVGHKYRAVHAVFPDPGRRARAPIEGVPLPRAKIAVAAEPEPALPLMTWVLGGVGVAGLGTGGVLRLIGSSDFDAMQQGCAARGCPESDIESLERKYLFSNIALGVGAAATVGAVLWYVLDRPAPADQGALAIVPAPDGRGPLATFHHRF